MECLVRFLQIAGIVSHHAVIPLAVGLAKLRWEITFTATLENSGADSSLAVVAAFARHFPSPIPAIGCTLFYWVAGSVFLSVAISYCSEIWQKKGNICLRAGDMGQCSVWLSDGCGCGDFFVDFPESLVHFAPRAAKCKVGFGSGESLLYVCGSRDS